MPWGGDGSEDLAGEGGVGEGVDEGVGEGAGEGADEGGG